MAMSVKQIRESKYEDLFPEIDPDIFTTRNCLAEAYEIIGNNLHIMRMIKGHTLSTMGYMLSLDPSGYRRIEIGIHRSDMRMPYYIFTICSAFGINPMILFKEDAFCHLRNEYEKASLSMKFKIAKWNCCEATTVRSMDRKGEV